MLFTEEPKLKSLFLPATHNLPTSPAGVSSEERSSGKAAVVLFGGYWPNDFTKKDTKPNEPTASSEAQQRSSSGGGATRLSDYVSRTSMLYPPSAQSIVTVLRNGEVEVFNLSDAHRGPYIKHRISPPLAGKLGLPTDALRGKVSCASLIPAEIALRRRLDECGHIAPGSYSSPLTKTSEGAKRVMSNPAGRSQYSPANGNDESAAIPRTLLKEASSANHSTNTSSDGQGGGADSGTNKGATTTTREGNSFHPNADIPTFSDSEWANTIDSYWAGVVGTTAGEVAVFDGRNYVFAFKTVSNAEVLQVAAVLLPAVENSLIKTKGNSRGGSPLLPGSKPKVGASQRKPLQSDVAFNPFPMAGPHSDGRNSGRESLLTLDCSQPSVIDYNTNSVHSVGFVTLQRDGAVSCWRLSRSDDKVMFPPIELQSPSMFAKVKCIHITHRYAIPFSLSNKFPRMPWSTGSVINDQRGPIPLTQPSGAAAVGSSDEMDSASPTIPLRTNDTFYSYISPAVNTPEPLPIVAAILCPENGRGGTMRVKDAYGRCIDEDVVLDGKLKRTTAMASDGSYAICAREKNVFLIDYTMRETRRLYTCDDIVSHVCYSHPIVVAGCVNGNIYILGCSYPSQVLAKYATYNGSRIRSLAFHYQSMLVSIVDDAGGEVEVVQLPDQFLRYGAIQREAFETRQAAAIRYHVASNEGSNKAAIRNAAEQRLLAQLSVPNCVQQYLSNTHILK